MNRVRVPAGVYVSGIAYGGRFVTPAQLADIADDTDDAGRAALFMFAAEQLDRAALREERLERHFQDDPKRYATRRAAAEDDRGRWEALADALGGQLGEEEEPEEAEPEPGDYEDFYEDFAVEWEIGFEYESAGGHGQSSSVDVNIRIRRNDGAEMGRAEMQEVLNQFLMRTYYESGNPVPPGYAVAGVDWQRPQGGFGWRTSNDPAGDLGAFHGVLLKGSEDPAGWYSRPQSIRAGSVRRR